MRKIITAIATFMILTAGLAHAGPTIHEFKQDSLAGIVASQKGHPFVLVIWSLDCEFCQSSLDTLSKKMRADKNFRVVTLSSDSLSDEQAAAMMTKKLTSLGLTGNAWAFGDEPPEQLRYALDKKWHGEMPRSYWFDASGKSVSRSGVITPANVDTIAQKR